MTTSSITKYRAQGAIILERLSGTTVPVGLKAYIVAFKKAHDDYEAAAVVADTTREKRDLALDAVGETDDAFDTGLDVLADKMVGAGLGTRQNPFAAYSRYAPSKLTELPYAEEPKAIRALGVALTRKKPPADVAKALAKSLKDAVGLEVALNKLIKPQAAYSKALGDRDALLPAWAKALGKLKKHAAAAWDEDVATYKAIFAPPGAIQAPTKKRAKKTAGEPVTPS
ncbi:MAG: hypothetical protein ACMG6S_37245 [Byssovorax sp.]